MNTQHNYSIDDLLYLMARLRDTETGCPWDCKQDFESITPHTLEETCEVIDAIERKDYPHLKEELGDLLFQVVFYGQLGEELSYFDFIGIVDSLVKKLLIRHPHVFPDGSLESSRDHAETPDMGEIRQQWEAIKQGEYSQRDESAALGDVPRTLSALARANKLQKRAANLKFDWPDYLPVVEKVHEELEEVLVEVEKDNKVRMEEELGDLMFACVNLARHLGIDSERALRLANRKFERRFEAMIELAEGLKEGGVGLETFPSLSSENKNALWEKVKAQEST